MFNNFLKTSLVIDYFNKRFKDRDMDLIEFRAENQNVVNVTWLRKVYN